MADGLPRAEKSATREIVLLRFELFVCDQERSVRFYEQALSFKVDSSDKSPSDAYIQIINGNVRIGLGSVESLADSHYFRPAIYDHPGVGVEIVLEVEDILEYERQARSADAVFEPLQQRPWGRLDFRVVDPDGYYIRVTERLTPPSLSTST
jgi:lactoylglutathione lyase